MASGCVPLFLDLNSLPSQTLALYPRQHLAAALRLPGLAISPAISIPPGGGRGSGEWYLQPAAFTVDAAALRPSLSLGPSPSPNLSLGTGRGPGAESTLAAAALAPSANRVPSYWRLAAYVLAHARRHLSSSAMAAHVLRPPSNPQPCRTPSSCHTAHHAPHTSPRAAPQVLRVLGLSVAEAVPLLFVTHCSEDFTADSLLHGLQAPQYVPCMCRHRSMYHACAGAIACATAGATACATACATAYIVHAPRCSTGGMHTARTTHTPRTHHARTTPLCGGPQALLGAENVTDVAFDTPGIPHAWCAEETTRLY